MAKLIFVSNDGTQEVIREDKNLCKSDVLLRSDYIATKLWCDEDVAKCLEEKGYEPSEENVAAVINSGELKGLNECSDGDWEIIYSAIHDVKDDLK